VITVWDDEWGIPHADGGDTAGAFYAQGWCQARDRCWQMAADRQRGLGRWSVWRGIGGVDDDRLSLQLELARAAERDLAGFDAPTRRAFESFADGVNDAVALGPPPVELRLLSASFELWEPWHSVLVFKVRHLKMGSMGKKLWRAMVLRARGAEAVTALRYDDEGAEMLSVPPGAAFQASAVTASELAAAVEALDLVASPGGSNAWVVSGSRTESGLPLLAGDPHRGLEVPNVYYQQHIRCAEFDAIGLAIPGVPGFTHFGHNATLAWCITHAYVDDQDLFVERLRPGQYLDNGAWQKLESEAVTIEVRDGADVEVLIERTRRGPIVVGGSGRGSGLSLSWTSVHKPNEGLTATLPMLRARTVAELHSAVAPWVEPGNSLLSADIEGHIGYRIRGEVPIRPVVNGWLPVPGDDPTYSWSGSVPQEELPQVIDPEAGYALSANNRPVGADYPHFLGVEFQPPGRAARIREHLESLTAATADDMISMLNDVLSRPAREFARRIRRLDPVNDEITLATDVLNDWTGEMQADSAAAALYAVVRNELTLEYLNRSGLRSVRDDWMNEDVAVGLTSDLWWIVPRLLRDDDTSLLGAATWDDLLSESVCRSVRMMTDRFGPDSRAWSWGGMHHTLIVHPLSRQFPDVASLLNPPSVPMAGDGDTLFASGFLGQYGFGTVYGSVARYVFDLADWDRSKWIVPLGSSGDPAARHGCDQQAFWAAGELISMRYSWPDIRATATSKTLLQQKQKENQT